jgi:hypothetical protein
VTSLERRDFARAGMVTRETAVSEVNDRPRGVWTSI